MDANQIVSSPGKSREESGAMIRFAEVSPIRLLFSLVAAFLLLLAILVGMISSWHTFTQASGWAVTAFILIIAIAAPVALLGLCGYLVARLWHALQDSRENANLERSMRQAEIDRHEAETLRVRIEAMVIHRTVTFDQVGNAAIIDAYGQVMQLRGQYQEHPNLHSLHYSVKQDNQAQAALPAPSLAMGKISIQEIVDQVTRNSYQIGLGRSLQSQEIIIAELLDSHIKVIGGTRMGKSCGAAGIIDQVQQTHDPDRLKFALLDLENKTSRLFAESDHLLTLTPEHIKMHATSVEQVASHLILLHQFMLHRYTLTEKQLARQPLILVYLEEFLYWKKLLSNFVSPQQRLAALQAFDGLATRGLKAGIHLMICAQVDYADQDLKDSMSQFLGLNMSYSVRPSAARAAGFVDSELLTANYKARTPGQFVVESIGGSDLGQSPDFDVRAKLRAMTTIEEEDFGDSQGIDFDVLGSDTGLPGIHTDALVESAGVTPHLLPVLADSDLQMDSEQAQLFRAHYLATGNIERSLQRVGIGKRYYRHASYIVRSEGLREGRNAL